MFVLRCLNRSGWFPLSMVYMDILLSIQAYRNQCHPQLVFPPRRIKIVVCGSRLTPHTRSAWLHLSLLFEKIHKRPPRGCYLLPHIYVKLVVGWIARDSFGIHIAVGHTCCRRNSGCHITSRNSICAWNTVPTAKNIVKSISFVIN